MKANTTTIFLAAIATALTVAGTAALPTAVFAQPSNTSTQTMGDDSLTGTFTQSNSATANPTATQDITGATGNNSPTTGTQSQTIDITQSNEATGTFTISPSQITTQSINPPTAGGTPPLP